MYLLNADTTVEWIIEKTNNVPSLGDLDLIFIDPNGGVEYVNSPFSAGNYVPPTATANGSISHTVKPQLEGFWRIRLVTGTPDSYTILGKVEMQVFDNTTVTSPYSDDIGRPAPYDINYYLQGFVVPGEIYGTFVASRTITIDENSPSSVAICETFGTIFATKLLILHNGSQIGEINFPVGSYVGSITCDPTLINVGDKLQLKIDAIVDDNISDIAVNLVGCCLVVPCSVL